MTTRGHKRRAPGIRTLRGSSSGAASGSPGRGWARARARIPVRPDVGRWSARRGWKDQIPYLARGGAGGHDRPAREPPLGSDGAAAAYAGGSTPATPSRPRRRRPTGRWSSALGATWASRCSRRRTPGAGCRPRQIAPGGGGRDPSRPAPVAHRRGARHRRGLGEGEPALLAARLAGRGSSSSASAHRAALDEADRGRVGWAMETDAETQAGWFRGGTTRCSTAEATARHAGATGCPGWSSTGPGRLVEASERKGGSPS